MWRYDTERCALQGRLLFADLQDGTLTLDCLLAADGKAAASPVTFTARFDERTLRSLDSAVQLLFKWADESVPVEVMVSDGRTGPQVRITSSSARVVLTTRPDA